MTNKPLTYKDAGVDIDAGAELVERIKPLVKRTQRAEVLSGLGGFGGMFAIPPDRYTEPVLVSGTDGVGTKLMLAQHLNCHDTIGIDLVAMCVNDVLVQGAEPLFFLDYFACGKLDTDVATAVISGIAEGCLQAGAALIGGETAEMPDMYSDGDYDLAGFTVGAVERENLIDGSTITAGDAIIGIASSGPHSNGYSLIRKILETSNTPLDTSFENRTLGDVLLTPTRIYVKSLLALMAEVPLHAIAHITGGGLPENLPRVLPDGHSAIIDQNSWPRAKIFSWLQTRGNIAEDEMLRTFNCGIGMVAVVAAQDVEQTLQALRSAGENAWHLGQIAADDGEVQYL